MSVATADLFLDAWLNISLIGVRCRGDKLLDVVPLGIMSSVPSPSIGGTRLGR